MYRPCLVLSLAILAAALPHAVRGDDRPVAREVQAIDEALPEIIKEAEPSVACILVSRSDAYSKLFHDTPPADSPGKLGAFDPGKQEPPVPRQRLRPFAPVDDVRRTGDTNKKYDLADPNAVPEAFGSGVVIDGQQLLILTNYHVVRDATKIYVRLPGEQGKVKGSYADIHAADPRSDLAVLRLLNENLKPLKPIKLGDASSVRKGQLVFSLANPWAAGFRDGSPSASWGILSNIHLPAGSSPLEEGQVHLRPLHAYHLLLQTDVKLNLGCSGGALLNLRGEMIGLTTARAAVTGSETAGGFALPLDKTTKRIIDRLRAGEEVEYGFLGITPERNSGTDDGILIAPREPPLPGSPAQKAGLQAGEVIQSINGIRLHNADDLYLTVATLLAGSEARLAVKGRSQLVTVTLAKSYLPGKIIAARRPGPVRGFRVDYTSVLAIKQESLGRQRWGVRREVQPGVYVCEIQPGSKAASLLRENDVISQVKVHGTWVLVNTPAEFYREAAKVSPNDPLELALATSDWQRPGPSDANTVVIP
jgi:S1-C subfamily serine protease